MLLNSNCNILSYFFMDWLLLILPYKYINTHHKYIIIIKLIVLNFIKIN